MLVLASDGIWTFISNQEVAQVVYPFYWTNDPSGAAESLIRRAYEYWSSVETGIIDDITCLVVFFEPLRQQHQQMAY